MWISKKKKGPFLGFPIAHYPDGTVENARKILDGIYRRRGSIGFVRICI